MARSYSDVYTKGLLPVPRRIQTGIKRTTFLTEHFFGGPNGQMSPDRVITVKIQNRGRKAAGQAEFDSRGNDRDDRTQYICKNFDAPYFYDREIITPADLRQMDFNEEPGMELTQEQRLLNAMAKKRDALRDLQDTALELQALEMLSTGKVEVLGHDDADIGLDSSMFYDCTASGHSKINAQNVNKLEWLADRCKAVTDLTGDIVSEIVLGTNVLMVLLADTNILAVYDNRRIEGEAIKFEKYNEQGVAYHGTIRIPGQGEVKLLTYNGKYTNASGNTTDIWPDKAMLFAHENVGNVNYAAVYHNDVEGAMSVMKPGKEFVHVNNGDGIPTTVEVCRQTSPLVMPMTMGGWLYATTVI